MDKGLHYLPSGDTYAETKSGVGTGKADGMALAYGNLRYSSGTVTFKAAWVHDSRQLAFFGNGGTMTDGSMKDVTDDWTLRFINFGSTAFFGKYEYDTTWGTDVPAVSKTGYTFSGYYDSLSGGNRVYGSTYAKESGLYWDDDSRWIGPSLILYAQFIPDSYTVTFNTNGGYWTSDSLQDSRSLGVTYDSTKNNKAYGQTDLYRPGYTFTDGEQIRMEQAMRCMTSTDTTRMKAATGRRITGNRKHNNTGYPWKHAIKSCGQISGYPVCVHNI